MKWLTHFHTVFTKQRYVVCVTVHHICFKFNIPLTNYSLALMYHHWSTMRQMFLKLMSEIFETNLEHVFL